MLTSADESDLLVALHDTTLENQRFPLFLERLRQRLRAAHVGLLIRRLDGSETGFVSGLDLVAEARRLGFNPRAVAERVPFARMRPSRVYSSGEFLDHGPELRDRYLAHLGAMGIVDERMVRVAATSDLQAWLVVSRGEACTASDSAILAALVPQLAVALRCHDARYRERFDVTLALAGLDRSATGLIGFDADGHVLAITPTASAWLKRATGRAPQIGKRVAGLRPDVQRHLASAATRFARDPAASEEALCLASEPRIEAILAPGPAVGFAVGRAAMVALCRIAPERSARRAAALAQLHDLPRREAELALLVAEGRSIAEAAEEMGLTLETARNYSKQLYARLGVRGQSELAALVCTGGAMLG